MILPHADEAGAVIAAERIRETVGAVLVPAGDQEVRFTVSIGVAVHSPKFSSDQLLECADQALYAAKKGGRDQVCVGRLLRGGNGESTFAPA